VLAAQERGDVLAVSRPLFLRIRELLIPLAIACSTSNMPRLTEWLFFSTSCHTDPLWVSYFDPHWCVITRLLAATILCINATRDEPSTERLI
jgi:hypothetical protein